MQGFKNLYTLEKGIQNYLKEKGDDMWTGSLFVFDARMAVRPGDIPILQSGKKCAGGMALSQRCRYLLL